MSHLFPGITPHRSGLPGSVWDLDISTWLSYVAAAEAHAEAVKKQRGRRGK